MRDIDHWLLNNMLKQNHDKTELVLFRSKNLNPVYIPTVTVGTEQPQLTKSLRLLGVNLDSHLLMNKQIQNVTSSCFYRLYNMFKV